MALILNIDTSTEICSVCLAIDGKPIATQETKEPNSHSLKLGQFVKSLFSETGYSIQDIDSVAVSEGPGSYTGLRIGISLAKGICFAANKPLISVGTLHSLAMGQKNKFDQNHLLVPMLDARRMEVYSAIFSHEAEILTSVSPIIISESSFIEEAAHKTLVLFGNGSKKCFDVLSTKNKIFIEGAITTSKNLAPISESHFASSKFVDVAYFEPFYLKEFIAAKAVIKGLD